MGQEEKTLVFCVKKEKHDRSRERKGRLIQRPLEYPKLEMMAAWTRVAIQNGDERPDLKMF